MEQFSSIHSQVSNWQQDDLPTKKLQEKGLAFLTDSELLSILINTGTKEKSAIVLAKEILALAYGNLDELGKLSLNDLQGVKGIGQSKACLILAAIELGRRRHSANPVNRIMVRNSKEIADYLKVTMKDLAFEVFAVIFLNRANKIKHFEIISQGGITGTVADPRIIMKKAIEESATSIILSHNHPSGNLIPSRADEEITQKIKNAASYFDIKVLDHIIVSDDGYFSFADEGMI